MSDRVSDRVPRVSVLMTIYNAAPYLRQSLDSLLGQTFEDWELIAIENGSSDSSPGILASYKDPRIGVFAVATNMGRTGGLRYAFKRARGEYIAVLDADDLSHRERLAAQVVRLDAEPDLGLLGTWAEVIDGAGVRLRAWEPPVGTAELHDRLGWENPIVHSSAMYRRALAEAAGGYPAAFAVAQDFALILALAERGRIGMIARHLCSIRVVSTSVTRSRATRLAAYEESHRLFRRATQLPLSAEAKRRNRTTTARLTIKCGVETMRLGSYWRGAWRIARGIAESPGALVDNGLTRRWFGLTKPFSASAG